MSDTEIYKYLKAFNCCNICCLRYLNGRKPEFTNLEEGFKSRNLNIIKDNESDICPACLNLFKDSTISLVLQKISEDPQLESYHCGRILTAIQFPVILNLQHLAIWYGLLKEFPNSISRTELPDIPIKEVLKFILNPKVCEITNREFDQNGIMIKINFEVKNEGEELNKLFKVFPGLFSDSKIERKKHALITRNTFEKNFVPKKISYETFTEHITVPPSSPLHAIELTSISFSGPTIFLAGRYNKYTRSLSQTPWILDGKRMMESSVQEKIIEGLSFYFGVPFENYIFSSSGREDVDVRCLGNGRPFVLEIIDSHRTELCDAIAIEMENNINKNEDIAVSNLQLVQREELVHIKTGEESKKKIYRALCYIKSPITLEILKTLDRKDGFVINQWTPLRVLHRRPLLSRPRTIFSVKPKYFKDKDDNEMLVIDIITQAGTYIKELVHGDFGRTEPSLSSMIDTCMDIVALDVLAIDLDWPPVVKRNLIKNGE